MFIIITRIVTNFHWSLLSDLVAGLITSAANKFLIHCVLVSSLSYFEILYATKKKKEENNYSGQRIVYLQWDSTSFSIQNTINEVKKWLQMSLSRIDSYLGNILKTFFHKTYLVKIFSTKRGCWISERHDVNECTSNAGNKPDFPRVRI